MLAFRKATVGTDIANFWDNKNNQIGFSRGDRGFVVINEETSALSRAFTTGLPAGSYCDVMAGGLKNGGCQGAAVVVAKDGMAKIDVPAMTALVIHVGQKQ